MEVDAWAPLAPNQTPPPTPSPFAVNLYDNIHKLNLDVRQIAALHGPRVATLDELKAAVGQGAPRTTTHYAGSGHRRASRRERRRAGRQLRCMGRPRRLPRQALRRAR